MKRKDWKIKDLKKDTYGNLKKKIKYKVRSKTLFLRKLYIRRNRYLNRKNLVFIYFLYRSMLNFYKFKKQNYVNNIFLKEKNNLKTFYPEFSVYKNVFNKKIVFKAFSKKHNLKYIFIKNKYNEKVFGLNYYTKSLPNNSVLFNDVLKDLDDDLNKNLIQFKNLENIFEIDKNVNLYLNFNINTLCILEIYKILIILYLNKINKKYI